MSRLKNDLKIYYFGNISLGVSERYNVRGICYNDKYCWTNMFGFEILK